MWRLAGSRRKQRTVLIPLPRNRKLRLGLDLDYALRIHRALHVHKVALLRVLQHEQPLDGIVRGARIGAGARETREQRGGVALRGCVASGETERCVHFECAVGRTLEKSVNAVQRMQMFGTAVALGCMRTRHGRRLAGSGCL